MSRIVASFRANWRGVAASFVFAGSFLVVSWICTWMWPELNWWALGLIAGAAIVNEVAGHVLTQGGGRVLPIPAATGAAYALLLVAAMVFQANRPSAWISSPRPTEHVDQQAVFTGCSANISDNESLWVVVRTAEPKFYASPTEPLEQGIWISRAVGLGRQIEDRGAEYNVSLWLANPEVAATLAQSTRDGISDIPKGARRLFAQTVRRTD